GAAAIVGAWGLALQRGTQPPHRSDTQVPREPLPWLLLGPLVVAAFGLGVLFGATEVLVVAFTEEQDQPGAAGLVLAIWSAGSLAAGLAIGALAPPADPVRRLRVAT